jgi:phosphoglycolate phosphatase
MDGTLVQTRSASWEIFQETAVRYGLPVRSAEEFFELFDGNFFESLDRLSSDPARADEVREHFLTALRERYTPTLIPGMADVVKQLAPHYALAVMSSNAMAAIRRTLEAGGVARCFAHVFSADVASSKKNHLRRVMADPLYGNVRRCTADYVEDRPVSGDEVVLVTDTVGDVREGVATGVRVVGVSWGMHSEESLLRGGAEFVACWPQELVTRLLPNGSCSPDGCACEAASCQAAGVCTVGERPAVGDRPSAPTTSAVRASLHLASGRRTEARRPGSNRTLNAPLPQRVDEELTSALVRIGRQP